MAFIHNHSSSGSMGSGGGVWGIYSSGQVSLRSHPIGLAAAVSLVREPGPWLTP
jgi:hypothetical protein